MHGFSREECYATPIVRSYCRSLVGRRIRVGTRKLYMSNIVSYAQDLVNVQRPRLQAISESLEEEAWSAAREHRWRTVRRLRNDTLTARLLTQSEREVARALLRATERITLFCGMHNYVIIVSQLFAWLADPKRRYMEEDTFDSVRQTLDFRYQKLIPSIRRVIR